MCLFYGVWFGCRRSRSGNIHFFRPFSWHTERWGWGVCLHSRKLWQLLQVGLCGGLSHFCALSRWQMVRSNTDLANLQIASPGGGTRSKMARWERRVLVGCEFFPKKNVDVSPLGMRARSLACFDWCYKNVYSRRFPHSCADPFVFCFLGLPCIILRQVSSTSWCPMMMRLDKYLIKSWQLRLPVARLSLNWFVSPLPWPPWQKEEHTLSRAFRYARLECWP